MPPKRQYHQQKNSRHDGKAMLRVHADAAAADGAAQGTLLTCTSWYRLAVSLFLVIAIRIDDQAVALVHAAVIGEIAVADILRQHRRASRYRRTGHRRCGIDPVVR